MVRQSVERVGSHRVRAMSLLRTLSESTRRWDTFSPTLASHTTRVLHGFGTQRSNCAISTILRVTFHIYFHRIRYVNVDSSVIKNTMNTIHVQVPEELEIGNPRAILSTLCTERHTFSNITMNNGLLIYSDRI